MWKLAKTNFVKFRFLFYRRVCVDWGRFCRLGRRRGAESRGRDDQSGELLSTLPRHAADYNIAKKDNQSGELLSALPRHAADHNSTKKRGPVRGTTFSTLGMPWTIILHRKDDQSGELLSALSSHAADYTIAKKRRLFRGTTFCNALAFRGL